MTEDRTPTMRLFTIISGVALIAACVPETAHFAHWIDVLLAGFGGVVVGLAAALD